MKRYRNKQTGVFVGMNPAFAAMDHLELVDDGEPEDEEPEKEDLELPKPRTNRAQSQRAPRKAKV